MENPLPILFGGKRPLHSKFEPGGGALEDQRKGSVYTEDVFVEYTSRDPLVGE